MTTERVHPKATGDRTEARVLAALVDIYDCVLTPWGENQRFDFVVQDEHGEFQRVQCKTGRLIDGAVMFNAFSATYHHPANQGTKHYVHDYVGDADLFGVYCSGTGCVYLLPVDDVPTSTVTLRISPPKNNQRARIRFAADYQVDPPK